MAKKGVAKTGGAKKKKALVIPAGFKRPKSITAAKAHAMVSLTAASMAPPRYICVPTGDPPAPCLRFWRDPKTGDYDIPPGGQPMDCATCRGG